MSRKDTQAPVVARDGENNFTVLKRKEKKLPEINIMAIIVLCQICKIYCNVFVNCL